MNKFLLHMEGLAVLLMCIYFYTVNEFSWVLFFLLLFSPDLFMLGYISNKKIGAVIYNIVHTYIFPIAIILAAIITSNDIILAVGIISAAHIGMDRTFGFGLKYPTDFKDTHLQRV